MMLFLKGIRGFKGLGSFSFQLLSGTPESQYSFATDKKTVTGSLFRKLSLQSKPRDLFRNISESWVAVA